MINGVKCCNEAPLRNNKNPSLFNQVFPLYGLNSGAAPYAKWSMYIIMVTNTYTHTFFVSSSWLELVVSEWEHRSDRQLYSGKRHHIETCDHDSSIWNILTNYEINCKSNKKKKSITTSMLNNRRSSTSSVTAGLLHIHFTISHKADSFSKIMTVCKRNDDCFFNQYVQYRG